MRWAFLRIQNGLVSMPIPMSMKGTPNRGKSLNGAGELVRDVPQAAAVTQKTANAVQGIPKTTIGQLPRE